MSGITKSVKEIRVREFIDITGATSIEATRFLKQTTYKLAPALDAFYDDPAAIRAAELNQESTAAGPGISKKLDKLWERYQDPKHVERTTIDGTILYCQDLDISPEDIILLAVAWLTKAPTMGKFSKKEWVECWRGLKKDTIELQKEHVSRLRTELNEPDTFRKVYNFTFEYAKTEGQKSMQLEIAHELWNLLIPLDPAGSFTATALAQWLEFLESKGSKAVSKDTWNLFLEFTRSIDPKFEHHDEEAAWPSLIDDFVEYARERIGR